MTSMLLGNAETDMCLFSKKIVMFLDVFSFFHSNKEHYSLLNIFP